MQELWPNYLRRLMQETAWFYESVLHGLEGSPARKYLLDRGIQQQTAQLFGVGYAGGSASATSYLTKFNAPFEAMVAAGLVSDDSPNRASEFLSGRITFPVRDLDGNTLGFGGRVIDNSIPKYVNTHDTEIFKKTEAIFGIDIAIDHIRASRQAIVVEGYLDVMMCNQVGIYNVVACLGTCLTEGHIRTLRRNCDELILATDNDAAGQRAVHTSKPTLKAMDMPFRVATLPGPEKDPCELIQTRGHPYEFLLAIENAK